MQVLDGVMFNKDVTHSKMRRRIENPRILLLDCPLEYKKGEVSTTALSYRVQEIARVPVVVSSTAAAAAATTFLYIKLQVFPSHRAWPNALV